MPGYLDPDYEPLLNSIPIGVFLIDQNFRLRYVNPAALPFFGDLTDIVDRDFDEVAHVLWPKGQADEVARVFRITLDTGEPYVTSECAVRIDRTTTEYYDWRIGRILLPDDGHGLICCFRDISEHVRERRAIAQSEARLLALIDASPLGIDIMDLEGNPIYFNPKCQELHGIDFSHARGGGWEKAVHPDDRERVALSWYTAAKSGRSWSDTYRFLHSDGRVVWVSGRAAPIIVDGQHTGFVGTLEDITDLKITEIERERLLDMEKRARHEAQRAVHLRDEVLAIVAHDLRNPINTIAMAASSLLDTPLEEYRRRRCVEMIKRAVRRMDSLIGDLLDVGRIESGTLSLHSTHVDLPALVNEAIEFFEQQARERDITLVCRCAPEIGDAVADRDRLAQVLSNILGNALKFTPRHGTVALQVRRNDREIQFSVEDTGPGITPDNLTHVFDRFWQADRSSRSGSGLGLTIAKSIIERHGGRIWVESTPGSGATFYFTLPFQDKSA